MHISLQPGVGAGIWWGTQRPGSRFPSRGEGSVSSSLALIGQGIARGFDLDWPPAGGWIAR